MISQLFDKIFDKILLFIGDVFYLSNWFMNLGLFFSFAKICICIRVFSDYQQLKREYCKKYSLFSLFDYIINYFIISFSLILWNVM